MNSDYYDVRFYAPHYEREYMERQYNIMVQALKFSDDNIEPIVNNGNMNVIVTIPVDAVFYGKDILTQALRDAVEDAIVENTGRCVDDFDFSIISISLKY